MPVAFFTIEFVGEFHRPRLVDLIGQMLVKSNLIAEIAVAVAATESRVSRRSEVLGQLLWDSEKKVMLMAVAVPCSLLMLLQRISRLTGFATAGTAESVKGCLMLVKSAFFGERLVAQATVAVPYRLLVFVACFCGL